MIIGGLALQSRVFVQINGILHSVQILKIKQIM
nr:MAG TPA: hypothetical protein [Caudoviricetes sp.]